MRGSTASVQVQREDERTVKKRILDVFYAVFSRYASFYRLRCKWFWFKSNHDPNKANSILTCTQFIHLFTCAVAKLECTEKFVTEIFSNILFKHSNLTSTLLSRKAFVDFAQIALLNSRNLLLLSLSLSLILWICWYVTRCCWKPNMLTNCWRANEIEMNLHDLWRQ